MSYIDSLKAVIAANIYENNNQEIIANMVKAALNSVVDMLFPQVSEDGWYLVDEALNVAMKYDADGLDAAKVSEHFKSLIGGGGGSVSGFSEVVEDGLYFVDESLRIGAFLDSEGLHAVNLLEYEIVNS